MGLSNNETKVRKRDLHISKNEGNFCDINSNGRLQNGHGEKAKGRYGLVPRHSLPNFLLDNEFLLDKHRPHIPSVSECIKTMFSLHTETVNIWTHLIGSSAMVVLMCYFMSLEGVTLSQKLWFAPFFLGSILCMGCSTVFHLFGCYSENAHKFLAKLDYAGIVVLIVASFPPWLKYGFYCQATEKYTYLVLIVSLGLVCTIAVMMDKFATPEYRKVRAGLFMTLGLTGLFPGLHYFYSAGIHHAINWGSWLIIMALWYLLGGSIYAMRIPERLKPGSFDIWCQSHQILHVCVMMGVLCCYIGITRLAEHRITGGMICPQ